MDPFTMALLAASAGLGVFNQQRTAARQNRQQIEGMNQLRQRQREATQRAMQEVEATRSSTPDQARETAASQYMDAVRRGEGSVEGALPSVAQASDAFEERRGQARGQVSDYASQMADLMSRIDAPVTQRREEAFGRQRAGSDINLIRNFAQGDDFVNQLRMQAIMPNPWLSIASQLGTGYALGKAGQPQAAPAPQAAASSGAGGIGGYRNWLDQMRRLQQMSSQGLGSI